MQKAAFIQLVADNMSTLRQIQYPKIQPAELEMERLHDEAFARDLYDAHADHYSNRTTEEIRRELFPTIKISLQGVLQ